MRSLALYTFTGFTLLYFMDDFTNIRRLPADVLDYVIILALHDLVQQHTLQCDHGLRAQHTVIASNASKK